MRKLTSRERFLLVAFGGLAVVGWIYGRGGNLGVGGPGDLNLAPLNYADPPIVELTRLEREPDNYDKAARNLFSYYVAPPPPKPPPAPRLKVESKPQPAPPVKRAQARSLPSQKPQPPRPSFRYIGFMGPKDKKIAVLEKGDTVLLASVGEILERQFKVLEFKYEILVLGYTADRWAGETTELPMKH